MASGVRGASDGIRTVSEWFNQFPAFKFDSGKDIIDEFRRLSTHLHLGKKARKTHFKALAAVVAHEVSESKSKSKYNALAAPFFAKFPKFNYRSSKLVASEFARLTGDQRWGERKKSAHVNTGPMLLLREVIAQELAKKLASPPNQSIKEEANKPSKELVATKTTDKKKTTTQTFTPDALKVPKTPITLKTTSKSPSKSHPSGVRIVNRELPDNGSDTGSEFFSKYDDFVHDPVADLVSEFDRLAVREKWAPGSKQYYRRRTECLAKAFEDDFHEIGPANWDDDDDDDDDGEAGVSLVQASKLAQWQTLCGELGVDPIPSTLTQCRKALKALNINLVDLVEARSRNRYSEDGLVQVRKFPSEAALAQYTLRTPGKIFPKKVAKRSGAVRELLVHVF